MIKQNQIREAVAVFHINMEFFQNSWRVWDSIGEGYIYKYTGKQCEKHFQDKNLQRRYYDRIINNNNKEGNDETIS